MNFQAICFTLLIGGIFIPLLFESVEKDIYIPFNILAFYTTLIVVLWEFSKW